MTGHPITALEELPQISTHSVADVKSNARVAAQSARLAWIWRRCPQRCGSGRSAWAPSSALAGERPLWPSAPHLRWPALALSHLTWSLFVLCYLPPLFGAGEDASLGGWWCCCRLGVKAAVTGRRPAAG